MARDNGYQVFGLKLRSELALPELFPADWQGEADVTIALCEVPLPLNARPGVHAENGTLTISIPDVARYRIENGLRVDVEPAPGAHAQNVRLFLLGSVLGLLLHQRGLLPLHANAVEIDGRAIAFMGGSGAGKSTLAAWFHDQGFHVLSDDVCVVDFGEDGCPTVRPGLTRLRLWREVLDATGRNPADYERSFIGEDTRDKYDVHLPRAGEAEESLPLAAIYLLDRGEVPRIDPLTGVEALEAAYANTYRGSYVDKVGSNRDHWAASVKLVQSTPMFRATRRWLLSELNEQSSFLLRHARALLDKETSATDECD